MELVTKPANRRDVAKARTREKALEAARELWSPPGSYDKVGIREIAKHMKMSTGAVFANFVGKEDLWLAAFDSPIPTDTAFTRMAIAYYIDSGLGWSVPEPYRRKAKEESK